MNLRTFSRRMDVVGTNVADNTDRMMRKVALKVDSTVVLATPVDTGRARSNWIVNLDAEAKGPIEAYEPGEAQSTAAANARAALEQANKTIAQYKAGQTIHITNNLDYIGRLNEGHSAQAPAAFVEEAVHAGIATVKGATLVTTVNRTEDAS